MQAETVSESPALPAPEEQRAAGESGAEEQAAAQVAPVERADSKAWGVKRVGEVEVFVEPGTGSEFKRASKDGATVVLQFPTRGLPPLYLAPFIAKPGLCSRHRDYRAIRKPRTNCPECWVAYEKAQQERGSNDAAGA